jgi:hypothetical protein
MSADTSTDWLLETIKGKSDQLNACDLVSGPEVIYVRRVIPAKDEKGKQSFWLDIGDGKQVDAKLIRIVYLMSVR